MVVYINNLDDKLPHCGVLLFIYLSYLVTVERYTIVFVNYPNIKPRTMESVYTQLYPNTKHQTNTEHSSWCVRESIHCSQGLLCASCCLYCIQSKLYLNGYYRCIPIISILFIVQKILWYKHTVYNGTENHSRIVQICIQENKVFK